MAESEGLLVARSELILGGQKSGKSRRAQDLAQAWRDAAPAHRALLVATALPADDEMRARIERHRRDRARQLPGMSTVEEPLALADCLVRHDDPSCLIVVDCLTLWLTNLTWSGEGPRRAAGRTGPDAEEAVDALLAAIAAARSPLVLVGNEIGLGVIPMGAEVRTFVDRLGRLNQRVAAACTRVTLMAAGLPLRLKDSP